MIKSFRQRAPKVRLVLHNRSNVFAAESVREGTCDLGLIYTAEWYRDILIAEETGLTMEVVLVAAPEFAHPDFITPHQHKPVSLITDETDSLFRRRLEHYLFEKDITLEETVELWGTEAIKRCVMEDLGFAYLPRVAVEAELADGRLIELDAPISGVTYPCLPCATKTTG